MRLKLSLSECQILQETFLMSSSWMKWKSLVTSYTPGGIEVYELEEAEGDGRPAGGRAGRRVAGRISAPW